MNPVRYDKPSRKARALAAAAALVACTAVMSGVLGLFMSASGESFSTLAGIKPAPPASAAVVVREQRPARRG